MTAAQAPILEIRGLRKSFHHVEVLRGIDLTVWPQQLVFIIGPSGSGKSTLLRCCNRLEEPTAGSIRVDGVVRQLSERPLDGDAVPQPVRGILRSSMDFFLEADRGTFVPFVSSWRSCVR